MKGVKRLCGLLLVLCTIFGLSFGVFSNDASALTPTWLSSQVNYRWATTGSYTPLVKSLNTSSMVQLWSGSSNASRLYLQFRGLNLSGSVTPAQSGNYYSGDFTVQLHFSGDNQNFNFTGGFNCDWLVDVRIQPETGTVLQHTDSVKSCRVTQTNLEADLYLTVSSSGKLSAVTSVSSYLIVIRGGGDSNPIFSAEVANNRTFYLTLMSPANINFTLSEDASTSGLGEINQSINNVNNQLQEMNDRDQQDRDTLSEQQSSSTQSAEQAGEEIAESGEQLLYVLTNFFDIFVHPPASDCIIDGDTGHMDLGDIDLCQLDPPPAISVLGTLLMIGAVIPLCVSGINTLIKIVQEVYTT